MLQHALERRVAQTDLVDERRRLGQEEVGAQAVEVQAVLLAVPPRSGGVMALVDQRNSRASDS